MTVNEKIGAVRGLMAQNGVDAIIIPGADPHMSEYFSHHWGTVTYISGFTGEAGTFVITKDIAGLWTDGRYYIQAAAEMSGSEGVLFKAAEPETPSIKDYLAEHLPEGAVVGINGRLFSAAFVKGLQKVWDKKGITINTHADYANDIWEGRPEEELTQVYNLGLEYAGKSAADKLADIRKSLKDNEADALIVSRLDNIAWMMNIRAADVTCNPVVISYAFVSQDKAVLYTEDSRVPAEVKAALAENSIEIRPYEAIFSDLSAMDEKLTIVCDETEANFSLYEAASGNEHLTVVDKTSPIPLMKACKNHVENENTFQAYIYDGIAEVEFYGWLAEEMAAGKEHTEWTLSQKLLSFRQQQPGFKGDSFTSIIGYRENAAMMHYAPQADTAKKIERSHLLLNDSGGQYLHGSTDTTRTIALGEITDEERRDFTLVLKSVIALSSVKFKEGTSGRDLDILARGNLWNLGIDYRCGTGHGVGYLLNIHEGPQSFRNREELKEGMVITVEPGVYTEGSHGVRTENTVVVRKDIKTEYGQFYRFDTFTVVPIDTTCLDLSLMTDAEIKWLNDYHKRVHETLADKVSPRAKAWLENATQPIAR